MVIPESRGGSRQEVREHGTGVCGETTAPEWDTQHTLLQDPAGAFLTPCTGLFTSFCLLLAVPSPPLWNRGVLSLLHCLLPAAVQQRTPTAQEVAGGPRRLVYRFLNVRCQLGVKSEPGDQLPGR